MFKSAKWNLLEKMIVKQHTITKASERKNLEGLAVPKIALNDDIYSLAYAAFIDTDQLEYKEDASFLQPINMNEEEVANIFFGSIAIVGL